VLGVEEPPAGTYSGDGDHEAAQADASTGSAEPARPPDRCTALLHIKVGPTARAAPGSDRRPVRRHGAPNDGDASTATMNDATRAPPELRETSIR
jgi:hypothetical protein